MKSVIILIGMFGFLSSVLAFNCGAGIGECTHGYYCDYISYNGSQGNCTRLPSQQALFASQKQRPIRCEIKNITHITNPDFMRLNDTFEFDLEKPETFPWEFHHTDGTISVSCIGGFNSVPVNPLEAVAHWEGKYAGASFTLDLESGAQSSFYQGWMRIESYYNGNKAATNVRLICRDKQ